MFIINPQDTHFLRKYHFFSATDTCHKRKPRFKKNRISNIFYETEVDILDWQKTTCQIYCFKCILV